jgi:CRISPR-associated protein Csx10
MEKLESPYYAQLPGDFHPVQPELREETHIRMNPGTSRVKTGDFFTYVALEAGQYFWGEMVCRDAQAWQELQGIAGIQENRIEQFRLGKATRRGYGAVSVVFTQADGPLPPLQNRLPDPFQSFTLLLLSDTIACDRWGRFLNTLTPEWLTEAVNIKNLKVEILRSFSRIRFVDSFYNHLGLPRWRDQALEAGSIIGIRLVKEGGDEVTKQEVWDRLQEIERYGIGFRQAEGFGRVVMNHPIFISAADPDNSPGLSINLPGSLNKANLPDSLPVQLEKSFINRWNIILDSQNWKLLEKTEFSAVARTLRSASKKTFTELHKILSAFGQADLSSLPGSEMPAGFQVNSQAVKLEKRAPKPFFTSPEGDGHPGMQVVFGLLDQLENLKLSPEHTRLGISLLADQVAQAAKKAEKGKG